MFRHLRSSETDCDWCHGARKLETIKARASCNLYFSFDTGVLLWSRMRSGACFWRGHRWVGFSTNEKRGTGGVLANQGPAAQAWAAQRVRGETQAGERSWRIGCGQSRSSLAPDRSRFGSRRRVWELFCGIRWTRGGRDIKKGGGQICGPRCVTLLGNPGYQQLHTLPAPSTPGTHCTNVHGTTRGWLVGSWWCPAQREALTAPESNHPTSTIQQKALRHDSCCCNLLSMRHYSLQYLTLRQNHTRLVITRAIKS